MDEIEALYEQAVALKNQIVRANLRLVVSIAKRHVDAREQNFFELVSDGNMSLIRAVEKFDFARGNKFSTYASWAIMKNFARTIPDEHRHRDRFRTSHDGDVLQHRGTSQRPVRTGKRADRNARRRSARSCERLDEREQKIIISRFGLDHGHEPQTLKEVGAEMGVTKERIRQIEARALSKLRHGGPGREDRRSRPDLSLAAVDSSEFTQHLPGRNAPGGLLSLRPKSGDRAQKEGPRRLLAAVQRTNG